MVATSYILFRFVNSKSGTAHHCVPFKIPPLLYLDVHTHFQEHITDKHCSVSYWASMRRHSSIN